MGLYIHKVCMYATHSRYVRHITTPLLTTNHCDSEIIALKEQTERQNIEIQALKAFFKEQVYILKK